jgi:hypothetical protein
MNGEAVTPPTQEPEQPTCPWCPYTGTLKQVLMHMESAHHRRWCDLALSPPIAGMGRCERVEGPSSSGASATGLARVPSTPGFT